MFTRRRVGIFAGAFAEKLNIETAARRSMHLSTDPIAALSAPFGQIGSTHGLGILPETARQIACLLEAIARHGYRSEVHTTELQSLMRISFAVLCLKK